MYMQGLANFLDDFLGGLMLISYALVVGSIIWAFVILKITSANRAADAVVQRAVAVLNIGAVALASSVGLKLIIKGAVLYGTLGELPMGAYANTVQFKAGLLRFCLALGFIGLARLLRRDPNRQNYWHAAAAFTLPLVISGAWLVHAVGRLENREFLMFMTVIHQLAAAIWFGCVAQLMALWWAGRGCDDAKAFWPVAITRFAWLGAGSVGLLLCTGIPLAWNYIGSIDGLFGTGYGSLVLSKVFLMMIALGIAYLNNRAGRLWRENQLDGAVIKKVPYYIEAETFILIGVLFIAATLSSQPPSEDIQDRMATVSEVAHMFAPRLPSFTSPTHDALMAGEPGRVAVVDKIPSVAGAEWSDYNHNIAGLFLTSMAVVAMLSYYRRFTWAQYWPLGFIGLGIFLFFRSDAETWPLGPIGFWESTFQNGEVFQHRIATTLVLFLGGMELRARTHPAARKLRYIFPMLCAFGGILLLTHAHAQFELKTEYLIQSTHLTMGLLAMIMASGRWLELRLASTGGVYIEGKLAGFTAILAMFLIGLILVFYLEPIY